MSSRLEHQYLTTPGEPALQPTGCYSSGACCSSSSSSGRSSGSLPNEVQVPASQDLQPACQPDIHGQIRGDPLENFNMYAALFWPAGTHMPFTQAPPPLTQRPSRDLDVTRYTRIALPPPTWQTLGQPVCQGFLQVRPSYSRVT